MKHRTRVELGAIATLLLVAAAACGSSSDEDDPSRTNPNNVDGGPGTDGPPGSDPDGSQNPDAPHPIDPGSDGGLGSDLTCPSLTMPAAASVYVDANATGAEAGTMAAPYRTLG